MAAIELIAWDFPSLDFDTPPRLRIETGSAGPLVRLSGQWTALALARERARTGVASRLAALARAAPAQWDLSAVERMDHVGGQALWRVWGRKLPEAETTLAPITEKAPGDEEAFLALERVRVLQHNLPGAIQALEKLSEVGRVPVCVMRSVAPLLIEMLPVPAASIVVPVT